MEILAIVAVVIVYTLGIYYAGYRKGEEDTNIRRNNVAKWR